MAYALCMLDKLGYKHTLRICNTYCFSTVKLVIRTLLNVMFVCTLSITLRFPHDLCLWTTPQDKTWYLPSMLSFIIMALDATYVRYALEIDACKTQNQLILLTTLST
jgi:hypothetical protein